MPMLVGLCRKKPRTSEWDSVEATPSINNRWDATPGRPDEGATPARWDATPGGNKWDATPGASRWDATPTPGRLGTEPTPKKNRWDETPTPGRVRLVAVFSIRLLPSPMQLSVLK